MSQIQIEPPHIVDAFQKESKYFIKLFLLDDSVNKNRWGINQDSLHKHIDKFKGKPLLLTPDIWHPHEFDHYTEDPTDTQKNIDEYRRLQKPYEIGTIVDIGSNLKQGSINHEYSALVEVTNTKAIEAFKEGKIPLFVSPSIYKINRDDADDNIGDWEPIHVAIVDSPAYGIQKANIRGHCQGDIVSCSTRLKEAGISCITKTLSNVKNLYQGSSINSSFTDKMNNLISYSMENTQNNTNQVSDQVTVTTTNPVSGQQIVEQKTNETKPIENRAPINPTTSSVPEPDNINPPGSEQQREEPNNDEEDAKLKAEIEALRNEVKSIKEFNAELQKKSKEAEAQAKRAKIESAVPKDYADSEEARKEAIEHFMNVPDKQLDFILNKFVAPTCSKSVRSAGRAPRVADFIENRETKNVKQAATNSSEDIEVMNTMLNFGGAL